LRRLILSIGVSVFFFKQKTAYDLSECLVGSEMCIRDRFWAALGLAAAWLFRRNRGGVDA
ncbi:hypothetical protein KZ850_11565, partial [Pseudomonas aeruginosa]|nr:hypothetical protein [Pseudomonas aeruginosa]